MVLINDERNSSDWGHIHLIQEPVPQIFGDLLFTPEDKKSLFLDQWFVRMMIKSLFWEVLCVCSQFLLVCCNSCDQTCLCACVHVHCMFMHVYVYTCTCMYGVCTCMCDSVHVCVHVCVHACVCVCTCMYMHVHVCVCAGVCVCGVGCCLLRCIDVD